MQEEAKNNGRAVVDRGGQKKKERTEDNYFVKETSKRNYPEGGENQGERQRHERSGKSESQTG